jgi:predicted extracellular nuclease
MPTPSPTPSPSPTPRALVVISQVYGGAGCSNANCSTFKNDFIELYNRGAAAVSLGGWSVQYASATGTGAWQVTALNNFTLAPGQHYLVQESGNANGVNSLPAPDASGSIALSATAGKVALINTVAALNGACPNTSAFVDLVGYGSTANCFESAPAPAPGTTTAVIRNTEGCADTDNNSADFKAGSPTPRNSVSTIHACASAQAETGESFLDSERALPSLYLLARREMFGGFYNAALGESLFGAFSELRPRAGLTRWRRGVWTYAPRGMRGGPPRPRGAWP